MTDNVDGEEQIALPRLPQVAFETRYLARGAGEQHLPPGTDCIADTEVDIPPNEALHVLRTHNTIKRRNFLDQHMLDAVAPIGPRCATNDTAAREHIARQKAEDAARRGGLQQLARLSLGPTNDEGFVTRTLGKRGTRRLAGATPDARVGIDDRAHEAGIILLHGNARLGAPRGACATAATGIAELGNLHLVIRHSELLTKERQPSSKHLLLVGIEDEHPHGCHEKDGVDGAPAEEQRPSSDGHEG